MQAFTERHTTPQALRCLAEMVADHGPAKDALLRATVAVGGAERPALEAALQEALHGRAAPLRDAAETALQAFCRGNPDGQTMLGSTMAPVGDDDSPGAHSRWYRHCGRCHAAAHSSSQSACYACAHHSLPRF